MRLVTGIQRPNQGYRVERNGLWKRSHAIENCVQPLELKFEMTVLISFFIYLLNFFGLLQKFVKYCECEIFISAC